jgi:hypothetical protein
VSVFEGEEVDEEEEVRVWGVVVLLTRLLRPAATVAVVAAGFATVIVTGASFAKASAAAIYS